MAFPLSILTGITKAANPLPPATPLYRDRAEVFARNPQGQIYGGIWDRDKSFAVPGGGIDDGEDVPTAGAREFTEETGMRVKNPQLLPIDPVVHLWDPAQRAKRPPDRQKYDGSRSHFVLADIDESAPQHTGPLDKWEANNRGFYSVEDALARMQGVTPLSPEAFAARVKVLQHLLAQKKSAGWLSGVTIKSAGGKWDALAKLMSGAGKAVGSTGSKFVKNYAGAGQGGNLAGASLLQHTASPLRPPTPAYWPKKIPTPSQLAHGAAEKLSEAGPIGNAAVVTARAGKNLLTTSPLTPALETIKPGLGRFGAPLTAAGVAGTAGYAGARALPDKVNSLLESAGVSDPKVLDDQWWSTMKAQPKLLWQAIAPAWAGGDPTKASKVPMHLLKNVVAQPNQFNWKAPSVSMKRVLKDPIGTAFTAGLAGDVLGNVDYNTHKGLPATITRTAADAINDGILQDDLTKSPLTNTVRDAVSPRLIEYLKSREGKQQMLGNLLEEFKKNKGVKKSGSLLSGAFVKLSADVPTMVSYMGTGGPYDRHQMLQSTILEEVDRRRKLLTNDYEKRMKLDRPETTNVVDLRGKNHRDFGPIQVRDLSAQQKHLAEATRDRNLYEQKTLVGIFGNALNPNVGRLSGESSDDYIRRIFSGPNKELAKMTANMKPPAPLEASIQWPLPSVRANPKYFSGPPARLPNDKVTGNIFDTPPLYVRNRSKPDLPADAFIESRPAGPLTPINSPQIASQLQPVPSAQTTGTAAITSGVKAPPPAIKAPATPAKSGSAKAQPSAVVIRGNPQHFPADGSADAFYRSLADHVKSLGYSVTEDAGDPKTLPTKADAWIGHSRGAGRFDYAPKGVNLIALGSHRNNAINHPEDKSFAGGKVTPAHFTLTDDMKRLLAERLKTPSLLKGAFVKLSADVPVWVPTFDPNSSFSRNERLRAAVNERNNLWNSVGYKPEITNLPPQTRFERVNPVTAIRESVRNRSPITPAEADSYLKFTPPPLPSDRPQGSGWVMPAAIAAGGIGLGALGMHLYNRFKKPKKRAEDDQSPSLLKGAAIQLFDDEEEDKPVKSKSWLPTLALGAGGVLGGMALGHYLNSKSPAQTPPVTAPQPPATAPKAPVQPPAAPPQVPAAAPKAPVQPAVAPPKAPVQPPPAAPQQPQVTTGGIKPPIAPPQPQPAPNAALNAGVRASNAGTLKAISPAYKMPQGLSPEEQVIFNNPERVLSSLSALDPAKVTPEEQAAMKNMLTQFSEAEAGAPDAQFPNLSELYRAGYAGDQQALQKAKVYQQILSKANEAAYGAKDFGNLNALAERDTSRPPVNNMPVYKLPGLENLSAFGYRDIQSLASAAAEGDPNVLPALRALGREGQFKLFKVLEDPSHRMVDTAEGESGASAFLVDPRAAALRGAVIQSGLSEELKPAPYDPTALANAEAMKALSPEQKMQLISDVRNPDVLGKALSALPPEAKQQAINNLASTFARNAQIRDNDMNLVDVQGYLDPSIQTSLAKLKGLSNYQPLGPDRWRDMSAMGGNLGEFLGPYKIRGTNALWTPEDIMSQQQSGPQDYPNYSPTQILTAASPDTDQNLVNDWTKVLTSNLRKNYTWDDANRGQIPMMTNDQLAPMMINLGRLKHYRPDVYNNVVANLQQQYGKVPGIYSRANRDMIPAYRDQIAEDSPMMEYNWDNKLSEWLRQHQHGWLNPQTGKSHNLAGLREMSIDQLPE